MVRKFFVGGNWKLNGDKTFVVQTAEWLKKCASPDVGKFYKLSKISLDSFATLQNQGCGVFPAPKLHNWKLVCFGAVL